VLRGYLANAGRLRTLGVEVVFSVRPSERFTAYANGASSDAKYVRVIDAPCPAELAGGTVASGGQIPGPAGVPGALSPQNCDVSGQVLPGLLKWSFSYRAEVNQPATLCGEGGQVYLGVHGYDR